MLFVTDLNGVSEPLNAIKGFEMDEEVNGAFTVSFTSFFHDNNPGYQLLGEESVINADGQDFRVKQLKEVRNRKSIVAISTFYDLIGERQNTIYGGTRTFNQFANFVFSGTGWTFSSVNVGGSVLIPNFGEDNIIKLTQALCKAFECEYKIMPGKHIQFAKQIGPDNDAQYRYGHNVKALTKSVDTTNLRTKIKGYGANNLVVTYTSPYASKFPNAGEAEPVRDERFTIGANLVEHVKKQLTDYPETSIELDSIELTDKELGERVWLIYEPLDIEFQTRVLSKNTVIRGNKFVTASVVIGNAVPRNMSDILTNQRVEIDENKKQVQSRFEQVNDRITLEVEEVGASIAGLEISIGEVEIYAKELDKSIALVNIKADNISLSVTDLRNNTNAQFNIMSNRIETKVSETDFNGRKIMSLIEQTPSSITLSAKKINFDGEVFGSSNARFEGEVRAERIIGNEISGVTLRTSNASKFIRMEDQQMTLWEGVYDKLHIGFKNEYGSSTQNPFIVMGYGQPNGRDKMVIEKPGQRFRMEYSAQDGISALNMTYSGNVSLTAENVLYLTTGTRVVSNNDIQAPNINATSTVKIKDHIKEYEGVAADIINRISVYEYYLIDDLQNSKFDNPQIGFIAEAATELKTGDAISMYKALSISWKALQEKDAEIKEMQKRIEDIELVLEVII